MVSFWEIAVKTSIGSLQAAIKKITDAVRQEGFTLLDIGVPHLLALAELPMHHRDPFDHLLIAQAITEHATFISEDLNTARYPVRMVTCSGTC
jgi:PIN domain nuclease of toxin-antitoxin system